jgi:hypothetical protein
LNLGLRYEYTTPYYGKAPIQNVNFDPKSGQLVYPKGDTDYLVNADHSNIGPRIGAAWQVPQKLVLRGGYGMFFSGEDIFGSDINLPLNPPQLIPITLAQIGTGPPPFKLSDRCPTASSPTTTPTSFRCALVKRTFTPHTCTSSTLPCSTCCLRTPRLKWPTWATAARICSSLTH